jgi:PAS domain S-box-containing protein
LFHSNAPIFGIDVNGNVNEWNDKTAEITGYSKDEAFNKPLGMHLICSAKHHSRYDFLLTHSFNYPCSVHIYCAEIEAVRAKGFRQCIAGK